MLNRFTSILLINGGDADESIMNWRCSVGIIVSRSGAFRIVKCRSDQNAK
jgi:hypothetical protein